MKLSQVLLKQHLERMARRHWYIQGKKVVGHTNAEKNVKENGFQVNDGIETFVKAQREKLKIDPNLVLELRLRKNENHPDYKIEPCYVYGDNDALLGGTHQAQVLTNTIISNEPFPWLSSIEHKQFKIPIEVHQQLERSILLSCVFDSEQKKLPKKKDPLRPAWNFPRDYGITDVRKNTLLSQHLGAACEQLQPTTDLTLVTNAKLRYPTKSHGKQLLFDLTAEVLFMSKRPLTAPMRGKTTATLPEISPMHCTVSIEKHHFYENTDLYPTSAKATWPYTHTAILHFNPTQIKNLYDSEVTADQSTGRLLMKAFTMAASQAVALQQGEIKEPITVQVVQSDGQHFQFAVFQLNTLDLEGAAGERNIFWLTPPLPLYDQCCYINGRPILDGYNPHVLQKLLAFTSNRCG